MLGLPSKNGDIAVRREAARSEVEHLASTATKYGSDIRRFSVTNFRLRTLAIEAMPDAGVDE